MQIIFLAYFSVEKKIKKLLQCRLLKNLPNMLSVKGTGYTW